ncbi:hypothetical protein [Pseudomonas sp. SDO5271_S396]
MSRVQDDSRLPTSLKNAHSVFNQALSKAQSGKPASGVPRQARANDAAPRWEAYKAIEAPGKTAADTIRYTTQDGEEVIVYRSSSPALYEQVVEDYHGRQAEAEGYRHSLDNDDTISYYEHITQIDTSHAEDGVITYQFGANRSVVTRSDTPDTFERLLHMKEVLGYKEQGYALVQDAQGALPIKSTAYKKIERLDNGLTLVEMQDGQRYVISEQLNPQSDSQMRYMADVLAQLESGKAEGYEVQTSLPADYDIDKVKVESVDEKTGLIHFQYDGHKYMLAPGDASGEKGSPLENVRIGLGGAGREIPEFGPGGEQLYDLLWALKATDGTDAHTTVIDAIKHDEVLTRDDDKPLRLEDVESITPPVDAGAVVASADLFKRIGLTPEQSAPESGALIVTLKNGERRVVIEALAPNAFKAYTEQSQALDDIARAEKDGYRLAGPDEYLPSTEDIRSLDEPGKYGDDLIGFTYQKPGGEEQKIVVSALTNPEMFAQVAGVRDERTLVDNDLDTLRAEHGLPGHDEVSVNTLETTEKNDDGEAMTVQELALKRMYDEYREGMNNGSIPVDDPRAKFVRALDAKSMATQGMSIIPEHGEAWKGAPSDPIDVTGRDVREEIFDMQAIDETLGTLVQDKTIAADLERFDQEAREKVSGGPEKVAEVEARLKESVTGDAYIKYLKALEKDGKGDLAQLDVQQTFMNLMQVDPELAQQFLQGLSRDSMIMELDEILGDPSKISDENNAIAAFDTTNYWLRAARGTVDIPSHLVGTWENTVQKLMLDKQDGAAFGRIYAELGDQYMRTGTLTDADIQKAFNAEKNAFKSLSSGEKGDLAKMFGTMRDTGTFGAVSGVFGLARGVYQLHGNPTGLAKTSEGRLAIANDFITFASFSNNFTTLGSKGMDLIFDTKIYEHLGLNKTIPDMWRKPGVQPPVDVDSDLAKHMKSQGFLPDKPDRFIPDDNGRFRVESGGANSGGAWITDDKGGNAVRGGSSNPANYPNFDPDAFKAGYLEGNNSKYRAVGSNTAHRIAGSMSRFIGSSSDLVGGVVGVVLGAFGIRDGLKNGDAVQTAAGFFGVVGGAGGIAAGLGSVNAAWGFFTGPAGRVLAGLGSAGFLVSAVFGFMGGIFGIVRGVKLQKASKQNWLQIKQYEKDGLLKDNGAENYVRLQTYLSNYRQRDTPDDQSIFDYRAQDWSDPDSVHKDYEGDGDNAVTKEHDFYGSNTGARL